jgi:hypothetical protein
MNTVTTGFKRGELQIFMASSNKGRSIMNNRTLAYMSILVQAKGKDTGLKFLIRKSGQDSIIMFKDGQKISFDPDTVDVDELLATINTWNRFIDARNNHGITDS